MTLAHLGVEHDLGCAVPPGKHFTNHYVIIIILLLLSLYLVATYSVSTPVWSCEVSHTRASPKSHIWDMWKVRYLGVFHSMSFLVWAWTLKLPTKICEALSNKKKALVVAFSVLRKLWKLSRNFNDISNELPSGRNLSWGGCWMAWGRGGGRWRSGCTWGRGGSGRGSSRCDPKTVSGSAAAYAGLSPSNSENTTLFSFHFIFVLFYTRI